MDDVDKYMRGGGSAGPRAVMAQAGEAHENDRGSDQHGKIIGRPSPTRQDACQNGDENKPKDPNRSGTWGSSACRSARANGLNNEPEPEHAADQREQGGPLEQLRPMPEDSLRHGNVLIQPV